MTRKVVRFVAEADDELVAAIDWYETQRTGLGSELWHAVHTIERIQEFPDAHAVVSGAPNDLPARAALVRKFPYKVVYLHLPEAVHVLAFAHLRRAPLYWKDRRPGES